MTFCVDIETIPDQTSGAAEKAKERIKVPSNYRDPKKIEAYIQEKAVEAWRQTALDGTYGHVWCIGTQLNNNPPLVIKEENEQETLERFWGLVETLAPGMFIGHNITRFDMRFLWQRSIINNVKPLVQPKDLTPFNPRFQDTMLMWTGERNKFISLQELAAALGITTDDSASGSDVFDLLEAGNEQAVLDHCAADVTATFQAWRRMTE